MAFNLEKLRLLALFKFRSDVKREPVTQHRVSNPFHAVSIVTPPGASVLRGTVCHAAAASAGQRFLAAGAPQLPFPGCPVSECRCRYQHHEDRRHSPRRSVDAGVHPSIGWYQAERRGRRGRRETD